MKRFYIVIFFIWTMAFNYGCTQFLASGALKETRALSRYTVSKDTRQNKSPGEHFDGGINFFITEKNAINIDLKNPEKNPEKNNDANISDDMKNHNLKTLGPWVGWKYYF